MSTIKLNLLQGLRQKKRVKEVIARLTANINCYNSVQRDSEQEIDVRKALELRSLAKKILVDLKLKLQDASRPIQRDILELSELKDEISFYQALDTQRGKIVATVPYSGAVEQHFEATVRKAEVDRKCMELQAQLDAMYSKIDAFNTSHYIEIEEITPEMLDEITVE